MAHGLAAKNVLRSNPGSAGRAILAESGCAGSLAWKGLGAPWENDTVSGLPGRWQTPGGVVEWLMAPVLKTGEGKPSAGSNPAPSVPRRLRASLE